MRRKCGCKSGRFVAYDTRKQSNSARGRRVVERRRNCKRKTAAVVVILAVDQQLDAGRYAVIGCKLKQNANEDCNSCASLVGPVLCFTACFIVLVIAP